MSKQLYIEPEKCLGCRTCELFCSMGHGDCCNPRLANVKVAAHEEERDGLCIPVICMQCEKSPCLEACPVKAISRDGSGTVLIDQNKCIGCRKCISACPVSAIGFNAEKRKAHKCDLCGGDPKCAKFCPTGAIMFKDADADRNAAVAAYFKEVLG